MALQLRRGSDAERVAITFAEGEIVYTTDTKKLYVGDGTTQGGMLVTGLVEGSNYRINVEGNDGTLIVNTFNNEINAYNIFANSFNGNLQGDVYSTDSTKVLDSVFKTLDISTIKSFANGSVAFVNDSPATTTEIKLISNTNRSVIKLTNEDLEGDLSTDGTPYGSIFFERSDISGNFTTAFITGRSNSLLFAVAESGGTYPLSNYAIMTNTGAWGFGTTTPTAKIHAAGDITADGVVRGEALKGSLVLDDLTTIINGIDGSIVTPSFVQFGSFTTVDRDEIVAANGMVIYNTTANRFQGYQNNSWINLDDGTPA